MQKYIRCLWVVLVLIGVTSCRDGIIERPVSSALSTPTSPMSALQTPTFSSPTPNALPTPFAPTATAETERETTPTPFATSTPVNTAVLTPTPVYTITSVRLPDECYEISPEDERVWGKLEFQPCSDFEFSPDEHYLGFFFGGPGFCGRGIIILNAQTSEVIYRSGVGNGLGFEFLTNGKVLISTGHCEGGQVSLLDPIAGEIRRLGGLGIGASNNVWNATRTAIAVSTTPYQGVEGAIWGYNVERDFLFLPEPEPGNWQLDDHLVWTPDGSHILYQHRAVSYTFASNTYIFPQARQIIRVNASTGEKQVLASDPQYDYHFCAGAYSRCDYWYGDWIQVRRFPFEPQEIVYTDDFYYIPEATCLLYGIDCNEPPELFALNWRTGELVPWDEAQLPTPTQ